MRPTYVVIHHSFNCTLFTDSWDDIVFKHTSWRYKDTAISKSEGKRLQAQGIKGVEPPWASVGFHAGVEKNPINNDYMIRTGRSVGLLGCHSKEFNRPCLEFVFIGNFNLEYPNTKMMETAAAFLAAWSITFDIPVNKIVPHSDFTKNNPCPGALFDMELLRDLVTEKTIPH